MADERRLTGLMLIQHDSEGAWLLWHGGVKGGGPRLLAFTHGELEQLDIAVTPRREASEPLAGVTTPEMGAAMAYDHPGVAAHQANAVPGAASWLRIGGSVSTSRAGARNRSEVR